MFSKMLFIIIAVGALACALLVIRQQRIDTFHNITQVHRRLLDHERTLWQMRAEIAQRCRPSQVRLAMEQISGEWSPLPALESEALPNLRLASQPDRPVNSDRRSTSSGRPPADM